MKTANKVARQEQPIWTRFDNRQRDFRSNRLKHASLLLDADNSPLGNFTLHLQQSRVTPYETMLGVKELEELHWMNSTRVSNSPYNLQSKYFSLRIQPSGNSQDHLLWSCPVPQQCCWQGTKAVGNRKGHYQRENQFIVLEEIPYGDRMDRNKRFNCSVIKLFIWSGRHASVLIWWVV